MLSWAQVRPHQAAPTSRRAAPFPRVSKVPPSSRTPTDAPGAPRPSEPPRELTPRRARLPRPPYGAPRTSPPAAPDAGPQRPRAPGPAHLPGWPQSPSPGVEGAPARGRSPGPAASAHRSQAAGPGGRAGPVPAPQDGAGSPCAASWRTRSQEPESAARMPRAGALPQPIGGSDGRRPAHSPGGRRIRAQPRAARRTRLCVRPRARPSAAAARKESGRGPLTWEGLRGRGSSPRSFRAAGAAARPAPAPPPPLGGPRRSQTFCRPGRAGRPRCGFESRNQGQQGSRPESKPPALEPKSQKVPSGCDQGKAAGPCLARQPAVGLLFGYLGQPWSS